MVEYADLDENSRYFLTNFSGSTGDALISQNELLLFVDGRYHTQADLEVDKNSITVIKMKLGKSIFKYMEREIKKNKTLAIVAKKISQGHLEILTETLKKKNIKILLLDSDPIIKDKYKYKKINKIIKIDTRISGLSSDEKFKQITKHLNKNEAILTTNLEEVSYLCNLRDFSKNYSSQIKGKCLITKHFAILFSDNSIINIGKNFKTHKLNEFEKYIKETENIDTIFIDKTTINAYDYALLKEKATNLEKNIIRRMKSIKTSAEIEHYKECFKKTDKAIFATKSFIEEYESISEYDISKELEKNFYKFGAKSLSFKSIVAKDRNSALAHYSYNSKTEILTDGSLVLIDCGAYYKGGYATDCTRVFVKGTPSKIQKKVYTTVLKGFLRALNKKIMKTTSGFTLDKLTRKILIKNKPTGFEFSHSLGHGIGINVHEFPPRLASSPTAKTHLELNMCFTIEPGLYNPEKFGIRLENSCYLAKKDKKLVIKSFSNMCFEKKLIDFSLLTQTEKKQLKLLNVQ